MWITFVTLTITEEIVVKNIRITCKSYSEISFFSVSIISLRDSSSFI